MKLSEVLADLAGADVSKFDEICIHITDDNNIDIVLRKGKINY